MELFVIRLLERGASVVTAGYDRNTPLHLAAMKGYTTIGKKLIGNGALIYARNKDQNTPLEISIHNENNEFSVMMVKSMEPARYIFTLLLLLYFGKFLLLKDFLEKL